MWPSFLGNNKNAEEIADTIAKKAYLREVVTKKKGLLARFTS